MVPHEGGDAVVEFGDVNSDGKFGCHIWADLAPFFLDGVAVGSGELDVTRMMLPVADAEDIEELGGATFRIGDPGFSVHRLQIDGEDAAKIPLAVVEIAFERIANWKMHVNLLCQGLDEDARPTPYEMRFLGAMDIHFTHFAPLGFPDEQTIDRAKEMIGDKSLPSRARSSYATEVTRDLDQREYLSLVLHEGSFASWLEAIRAQYKIVDGYPMVPLAGDAGRLPQWWSGPDSGRDLQHSLLPHRDNQERLVIIDSEARGLHFYTHSKLDKD